jgi:branched-chain amino acid aminotransferase
MEASEKGICYFDGEYIPVTEARISIHDRCYLYGDGIFEGIPVRYGGPFKLDMHLTRLFNGLAYLKIESPVSRDEMRMISLEVIKLNKLVNGYIRPQISRGVGLSADKCEADELKRGPMLVVMPGPPALNIQADYIRKAGQAAKGTVVSVRRIPPACMSSAAKTCNYLNNILGAVDRSAARADVGFMLDTYGNVAEGIAYNVFIVQNNTLVTPTEKNILVGCTRAAIIEIAGREGYEIREYDFDVLRLYAADEVFIASSGIDIIAVGEIDGRIIGNGKPGPITVKLMNLLDEEMRKEARQFTKTPGS